MRRLVWMVFVAAAAYSAYEVHSKGWEGAFGGVLAGRLDPIQSNGPLSADDDAGE